jgi:hypothetical protein
VSAGHAGNPDFVRGAAAKFILHGYDGHILAPSPVLDGSNTRDEMRGRVLVKPIFYSFEAVLTGFTLLEFAKIEKCSATFEG